MSPPPTFNLLTEPFVPVVWRDDPDHPRRPGEPAEDTDRPPALSLRDLFLRADDIADIAVPFPPAASGFMRILYVLASEITGLTDYDDPDEWDDKRRGLAEADRFDVDAVNDVLGPAAEERWDLFHPRFPWLQDPRLADQCPKSTGVNKFVWGRAAGSNQVFISHDVDAVQRPIPATEAIWHLIAWAYYGPSGRCSSRVVGGRSEANVTAGPLRRSLSVHPWGSTLYKTLIAGQVHADFDPDEDVPAWKEPRPNDPFGVPPEPRGHRLLAGQLRHAMLLVPDDDGSMVTDAYATWAWRGSYPSVTDPYLVYAINAKNERFPKYADADRAIWRDLDALLRQDPGDRKVIRPSVLDAASGFDVDFLKTLRIRVFGFDQDGQTRDRQYFTANTPPILDALAEDLERAQCIRMSVTAGTSSGYSLSSALSAAWRDATKADPKKTPPWLEKGVARYWSEAEREFWRIVTVDAPPGPEAPIPNTFILLAMRIYDAVTEEYAFNARLVRAIEEQRRRLFTGWQKQERGDE